MKFVTIFIVNKIVTFNNNDSSIRNKIFIFQKFKNGVNWGNQVGLLIDCIHKVDKTKLYWTLGVPGANGLVLQQKSKAAFIDTLTKLRFSVKINSNALF